jgi:hypothetical protein
MSLDVEIAVGVPRPTAVSWLVFDPFGQVFATQDIQIPAGDGAKLGVLAAQLEDTSEILRVVVSGGGLVTGYTSFESRAHANASRVVTINAATPDADGDGIPDAVDNCPTTPNADQANRDGTGLGDACSGSVDGGACGTPIIALHAGGPTVGDFIDDTTPPIRWNAGTPYTLDGGSVDTSGLTCGAPSAVYTSYRFINAPASMSYTFTGLAASHAYSIRLHFAELFDTAAGQRQFNVYANEQMIVGPNFDVIGAVGAPLKALVVPAMATSDASATLALRFESIAGKDGAIVSGIEILP